MNDIKWGFKPNSSDYLCHYGVKGMRWGKRHVDKRGRVHDVDGNTTRYTSVGVVDGVDDRGNNYKDYTYYHDDPNGLRYPVGYERVTTPTEVERREKTNEKLKNATNIVSKAKIVVDHIINSVGDMLWTTFSEIFLKKK